MRAAVALLFLVFGYPSLAHEAPTGWTYDVSCCSTMDCREVPNSWVDEQASGITMRPTGELIPTGSHKIRQSKDDRWHWCTRSGKDDTPTICIYRPLRGF